MRISGGRARGIPLVVPAGNAVRPATDAMRQAVFSSLGARVEEAVFLDLCAGSGAYGLEALSRGAARGWLVEKNPKALACLRRNAETVARSAGVGPGRVEVLALDVTSPALWPVVGAADLVFLDPPYELVATLAPLLLAALAAHLAPAAAPLVVFEHPGEVTPSHPRWRTRKELGRRAVRQPAVTMLKLAPP